MLPLSPPSLSKKHIFTLKLIVASRRQPTLTKGGSIPEWHCRSARLKLQENTGVCLIVICIRRLQ